MKKYEESPFSHLSDEKLNDYLKLMDHEFSEVDIKATIDKTAQQTNKMKFGFWQLRNNKKAKLVVLAIFLFIFIPTTVFATAKLWEIYFRVDNYSSKLTVKKNDAEISSSYKKNDTFYRLEMNYLPNNWGSIPINEGDVPSKIWNLNTKDSRETISTMLFKLKKENNFESLYTKNSQELTLNNHRVWLIEKSGRYDTDIDREAFVFFEDEGYVLLVMIGENVTNLELKNIISGFSLVESTLEKSSHVFDLDEYLKPSTPSGYVDKNGIAHPYKEGNEEKESSLSEYKLTIDKSLIKHDNEQIKFGLESDVSGIAEIGMSVTDIKTYDHINENIDWKNDPFIMNEIDTILLPEGLIDKDANFPDFKITTYQQGDGSNSIDEPIKTEHSKLKWIEITVTLENMSNFNIDELYFQPNLIVLKEDGNFFIEKYEETDNQYTTPLFYGKQNNVPISYIDIHGKDKGYLNVGKIQKKSSVEITCGAFVPVEDIENLFLDSINYNIYSQENSEKIQLFSE